MNICRQVNSAGRDQVTWSNLSDQHQVVFPSKLGCKELLWVLVYKVLYSPPFHRSFVMQSFCIFQLNFKNVCSAFQATSESMWITEAKVKRSRHAEEAHRPVLVSYLHFIKERPHLLQWDWDAAETTQGQMRHLHQPFPKFLRHFPVALPLANLTVNNPSSLLGPSNHSLPLVTEERQLQAELFPGEEIIRKKRKKKTVLDSVTRSASIPFP